ncbi:hypothetical protein Thimo_3064 [Thioflavicoccus mobilis 8321]|uniref:Uncharacterized protein n=1 Tax=Thioflavicoccus mobilis 8321 TaxID=765912 RepID=L0H0J8_9GAMM|nr:hypothetical protein Thimo_3064 [Thioflavicoccus mobilis 8321]
MNNGLGLVRYAMTFMLGSGIALSPGAVLAGADCGSQDPASPCMANQVSTQRGSTDFVWQFDCSGGPCQVGRFVTGSPWVRHPAGGVVTITGVSPDTSSDGFEKNPATGGVNMQGLLACSADDSAYEVTRDLSTQLPYDAAPDNGVYLKAKRYEGDCIAVFTKSVGDFCVAAYGSLTVLKQLPPDGKLGAKTFRPSLTGNTKRFFTLDDFDFARLPSLKDLPPTGTYSEIVTRWQGPVISLFIDKNGDQGRRWTPEPEVGLPDYAADKAERWNMDMFVTFTNDAFANKKDAVLALLQYAIDVYGAYVDGVRWVSGAGQGQGYWAPIVFLGALSTDSSVVANVRAATENMGMYEDGQNVQFTELHQIGVSRDGVNPIWGGFPGGSSISDGCAGGDSAGRGVYWANYTDATLRDTRKKKTCGDPYRFIDGPAEQPGSEYAACCSTGIYVSIGLAMKIWPEFRSAANNNMMIRFADRIMDGAGWWTQPDQCAAIDPRESSECNPYTAGKAASTCQYFGLTWGHNSNTNDCVTLAEAQANNWGDGQTPSPRWTAQHLTGRPTLDREKPGAELWDMFAAEANGEDEPIPAPNKPFKNQ